MATDLNVVAVTGRLGRDPELRSVGDTSVCELRLAVNNRRKVEGEWGDKTAWIDVQCWGSHAEACARFLAKGRQVAVSGELGFDEWTDKEGNKRTRHRVENARVTFIGPREDGPRQADDFSAPAEDPIDW